MEVEYDPGKRAATLRKRGLDMARAAEIFDGPHISGEDDRRDYGEVRWFTVGFLEDRMMAIVWTWRGDVVRIISMRKANERERKIYGNRLGI